MKWRKTSQIEVEQTLKKPDKSDPTKEGRWNAFKTIGECHPSR